MVTPAGFGRLWERHIRVRRLPTLTSPDPSRSACHWAYSDVPMDYSFLVDTYASERLKTLSVWAMFDDADLDVRPHPNLARDRTFREHMVHQCMSEDKWFTGMFMIDVGAPPLAAEETRLAFIRRYAEDSAKRLARL